MICNLLVVDDDIINLKLVQNYLKDFPLLRIRTEKDPLKVAEIIKEDKIHIIMCDIMMPEMDGLSLLKEVKKMDPMIHCIMMTSYSSINKVAASMALGAHDFIQKPFRNQTDISEVINQSIARWNRWDRVFKDSKDSNE